MHIFIATNKFHCISLTYKYQKITYYNFKEFFLPCLIRYITILYIKTLIINETGNIYTAKVYWTIFTITHNITKLTGSAKSFQVFAFFFSPQIDFCWCWAEWKRRCKISSNTLQLKKKKNYLPFLEAYFFQEKKNVLILEDNSSLHNSFIYLLIICNSHKPLSFLQSSFLRTPLDVFHLGAHQWNAVDRLIFIHLTCMLWIFCNCFSGPHFVAELSLV